MSDKEFNLVIQFYCNFELARAGHMLARTIICLVIFFFLARTLAFFLSDVVSRSLATIPHLQRPTNEWPNATA